MIRRTSHFSGHVQGVGFRFQAQGQARRFPVRGYVRNLPDGRVELVMEGDEPVIQQVLDEIDRQMGQFIKRRTDADSPATHEFEDFSIRR